MMVSIDQFMEHWWWTYDGAWGNYRILIGENQSTQ